jgi:carboxymethylenebutenolidase
MSAPEIDPTKVAREPFNRRVFVGISAAATLAAAAPAGAQEALGQIHAPLVPEDDPAIVVERVALDRADIVLAAYAAWPKSAGSQTPSVVVIMHVWGVDTSIRDVVRRYAKAGFAAIAPDLYGRFGAPSGDGSTDYTIFRPYAKQLDRSQMRGDVAAAVTWLRAKFSQTKAAITGFCMGGHIVLEETIDNGPLFLAAAPFYGAVAGIDPKAVKIPICGSYGGRDTGIPAADVRAFAAALTVPNDFKIYDEAGHAFFDDQRASYVASAAQDAWERTIAWFRRYLGAGAVPAC